MKIAKCVKIVMARNYLVRCETKVPVKMPRGELEDYVLLCSYEDLNHILHGIGMKKSTDGIVQVHLARVEKSSFTEDSTGCTLTVSNDIEESKVIKVNPVLHYVRTEGKNLRKFPDEEVKDPISHLLMFGLRRTLHEYHGFYMVQTPGVIQAHPAFVFKSNDGQLTALPTTTSIARAPGVVYVNHLQTALRGRSFWRATCFLPLDKTPVTVQLPVSWAKEIDVVAFRAVITAAILTFNALNCDGCGCELCDEDGVAPSSAYIDPCAYEMD